MDAGDVDTMTVAPMPDLQRHWWASERLFPDPNLVMSTQFRVAGEMDIETMRADVDDVVLRHEALRTNFARVAGTPAQVIHQEPAPSTVWYRDLRHLVPGAVETALRELAEAEELRRFDLAVDPHVSVGLVWSPKSVGVSFIFDQGAPGDGVTTFGGMPAWPYDVAVRARAERTDPSSPDFKFRLKIEREILSGAVGYDANVFTETDIDEIVRDDVERLESIISGNPDRALPVINRAGALNSTRTGSRDVDFRELGDP